MLLYYESDQALRHSDRDGRTHGAEECRVTAVDQEFTLALDNSEPVHAEKRIHYVNISLREDERCPHR